jgi:hypothetical protein
MRAQLTPSFILFLDDDDEPHHIGVTMLGDAVCPYCSDTGQIRLKQKKAFMVDRNGKPMEEYRYYTCFCVNNRTISNQYNQLAGIPAITPEQALKASKFAGLRNLLLFGHSLKFLHLVKSMMVLHANYHKTFEMLNGYDVIKKYYVEQPTGEHRSIADLEEMDLLVFTFDTSMENRAQNRVVFEVIKRRCRMNDPTKMQQGKPVDKPTWIYASSQENFKESKEYSADIEELIEFFTTLNLSKYSVPFKVKESTAVRQGIDINQSVGDL